MLSFTYRYKTRDIIKNFSIDEGKTLILNLLSNDFKVGTLFTIDKEIFIEQDKKSLFKLRERELNVKLEPNLSHNKEKIRILKPLANGYLHHLNITDAAGNVFKNAQDKFKQINHFIEVLSPLIKELPSGSVQNVLDMGSGKGYLTFALYDYLHQKLNLKAKVTGVEFRDDLVALCNEIAKKSNFEQLHFVQGTIQDYQVTDINLLIALHACDTATDEAIFKGIEANAQLIVVAPCCHKQIRREIAKNKVQNDISFLTKHGIFLERQAEMATDGLRALILEYYGYKTKVFEFISDAHTPKNVLIVAVKQKTHELKLKDKTKILAQIKASKSFFGIDYHHLEKLLKML
jgi:SAM-dependent methyltransferase